MSREEVTVKRSPPPEEMFDEKEKILLITKENLLAKGIDPKTVKINIHNVFSHYYRVNVLASTGSMFGGMAIVDSFFFTGIELVPEKRKTR